MYGRRYATKARTYTPSKYAPRGPVASAPAPLSTDITLHLYDGSQVRGAVAHKGFPFRNPAELATWMWQYSTKQARDFAADSVTVDEQVIALTAIAAVR